MNKLIVGAFLAMAFGLGFSTQTASAYDCDYGYRGRSFAPNYRYVNPNRAGIDIRFGNSSFNRGYNYNRQNNFYRGNSYNRVPNRYQPPVRYSNFNRGFGRGYCPRY